MLEIRPISIHDANIYIEQIHRHHGGKVGCKFAIACYDGNDLHGVAICSNPVARNADDGLTLEVSRLCTDGTYNACSILYGACARIAREMGYKKIQTYILQSESGASLKASGWICEGEAGRPTWGGDGQAKDRRPEMHTSKWNCFQAKSRLKKWKWDGQRPSINHFIVFHIALVI